MVSWSTSIVFAGKAVLVRLQGLADWLTGLAAWTGWPADQLLKQIYEFIKNDTPPWIRKVLNNHTLVSILCVI
jgi:hypothetical protein